MKRLIRAADGIPYQGLSTGARCDKAAELLGIDRTMMFNYITTLGSPDKSLTQILQYEPNGLEAKKLVRFIKRHDTYLKTGEWPGAGRSGPSGQHNVLSSSQRLPSMRIHANKGSSADFLNALNDKIAEFGGVNSSVNSNEDIDYSSIDWSALADDPIYGGAGWITDLMQRGGKPEQYMQEWKRKTGLDAFESGDKCRDQFRSWARAMLDGEDYEQYETWEEPSDEAEEVAAGTEVTLSELESFRDSFNSECIEISDVQLWIYQCPDGILEDNLQNMYNHCLSDNDDLGTIESLLCTLIDDFIAMEDPVDDSLVTI